MPLCISNPPIPRKNSSHCTPPTPTHTPLLSQRITHSPSSVGAHPTPKTPNDKDLAHTPSQVLLKHWSHAPAHTVAQCTPRYGPSYGEVQITVPPRGILHYGSNHKHLPKSEVHIFTRPHCSPMVTPSACCQPQTGYRQG